MPQEFQVLRCYQCSVFQVHQIKKSMKWECKLCGSQQSFKRNYGSGCSKECRMHVQKLNTLRGEVAEHNSNVENDGVLNNAEEKNVIKIENTQSKWIKYVSDADDSMSCLDVSQKDSENCDPRFEKDFESKSGPQHPSQNIQWQGKHHLSFKSHDMSKVSSAKRMKYETNSLGVESSHTVNMSEYSKSKDNILGNCNSKWGKYIAGESISTKSPEKTHSIFNKEDDIDLDKVFNF